MSEAERTDDPPPSDPDREAILRRRQRFVATALGGLAASLSAGCPQPQPCLKVSAPPQSSSGGADEGKTGEGKTGEGKTGEGKTGEGKTGEGKTGEGGGEGGKTGAPAPQPSVRPAPQVCLRLRPATDQDLPPPAEPETKTLEAAPGPCLKVAPPPDEDDPRFQPR